MLPEQLDIAVTKAFEAVKEVERLSKELLGPEWEYKVELLLKFDQFETEPPVSE